MHIYDCERPFVSVKLAGRREQRRRTRGSALRAAALATRNTRNAAGAEPHAHVVGRRSEEEAEGRGAPSVVARDAERGRTGAHRTARRRRAQQHEQHSACDPRAGQIMNLPL